jgi:hypothetical protein
MVAPRPISDTTYAILPVAGYVASGKVEDFMLFHKNVAHSATFL